MKKMITELDKLLAHKDELTDEELKIRKKSTLMNESRCEIFEFLCSHPCSSVSSIAKGLNISESRVRWHLEKLVWDKLVKLKENSNTIFFPSNMINPEHINIFKLLAVDRSNSIFESIKRNEGLYQNELSKKLDLNTRTVMKYTSDLEYFGLIRGANDGKYKRYYLTDRMDELRDYYRKNAKNFKEYVLKRTKMDGLRPKVILSTPEVLRLKLITGTKTRVLNVPLIPFSESKHDLKGMKKDRYKGVKGLFSLI